MNHVIVDVRDLGNCRLVKQHLAEFVPPSEISHTTVYNEEEDCKLIRIRTNMADPAYFFRDTGIEFEYAYFTTFKL